jgi:hypothetical protein
VGGASFRRGRESGWKGEGGGFEILQVPTPLVTVIIKLPTKTKLIYRQEQC